MRNFQLQTPQRDQSSTNRRQKSVSDLNKNQQKVMRKSLDPAFKAVQGDDSVVLKGLKELAEASDENPFGESAENLIASVPPVDNSSEVATSDLASQLPLSSSATTSHKHVPTSEKNKKGPEVDSFNKIGSIKAEVVIKHLREAKVQVLISKDLGPSKKLIAALINVIIEEFQGGLYEENDCLDKILSRKSNLVVLSFGMGIFAMFMLWFFNLSSMGSFTSPT